MRGIIGVKVNMSGLSNNAYKWHLCNLILNMVRAAKRLPIKDDADNPYGLMAKSEKG